MIVDSFTGGGVFSFWFWRLGKSSGISALGFGMRERASEPESGVVRHVITGLENKRAYSRSVWEESSHVVQSLLKIWDELIIGLKRVGDHHQPSRPFASCGPPARISQLLPGADCGGRAHDDIGRSGAEAGTAGSSSSCSSILAASLRSQLANCPISLERMASLSRPFCDCSGDPKANASFGPI